jgi:hypothetical protein
MKKAFSMIVLLALALGIAALAEDAVAMRIVTCPEQDFSTLCKPEYDYSFTPDGGVLIELGPNAADPTVQVFKTDAPGADFDAEYYLSNVYRRQVSDSADQVVNPGEYTIITLGGKELPAIMMLYLVEGESRYCLCAYDLQADYFVRYEARCPGTDIPIEEALTALAVAVGNFHPDADYYSH